MAEFRFRRREFEEVYLLYRQLEEKWEFINPGAVAAIYGRCYVVQNPLKWHPA